MLKTNIMGIEINTPIIISPGPWSSGKKKLKKALCSGVGAVFTESIVSESCAEKGPWYAYDKKSQGVENTKLYTSIELEEWLEILHEVDEEKRYGSETKIIASIMGSSQSELKYIAKKVEKTGVDGIEVGLACPMNEGPEVIAGNADKVYEYTRTVVEAVNMPVSVKLTAITADLPKVVKAVKRAGASGISAIDSIRGILNVDIDARRVGLRTYGGISGSPIKPMGLSTVAGIAQCTDLPIAGMGGINDYRDILEYIMLGASSCGLATTILLNGYDHIKKIQADLSKWANDNGIKHIDEIRGSALSGLRAFEEIKPERKKAYLRKTCKNEACGQCVTSCIEEAIAFKDRIEIDEELCNGCGLCCSVCPEGLISIHWASDR